MANVELQAEKTRLQFEANRDVVRGVLSWFYGFSLVLLLAFVASQQVPMRWFSSLNGERERERQSSVLIICLVTAKFGDHRPVAV